MPHFPHLPTPQREQLYREIFGELDRTVGALKQVKSPRSLDYIWFALNELKPTSFTNKTDMRYVFIHVAIENGYDELAIAGKMQKECASVSIGKSAMKKGRELATNHLDWIRAVAVVMA